MITTQWSNSEAAIDVSGNVFDDFDYDQQCADIRNENAELIRSSVPGWLMRGCRRRRSEAIATTWTFI